MGIIDTALTHAMLCLWPGWAAPSTHANHFTRLSTHIQCPTRHLVLQTYEGGLGGEPGNEAHGGYAYCGVAAGALAGCLGCLDLPALQAWAASMQVSMLVGPQVPMRSVVGYLR